MNPPLWALAWMFHMLWSAHPADTLIPRRLWSSYGMVCAQSSCLNSDFLSLYLRGRYIGEDVKVRSYDRLRARNRAGSELSWGITYAHQPDSGFMGRHQLGWHLHLSGTTLATAYFGDDVARLLLYGNAPWAGDTLRLDPARFRSLTWQELGGGLYQFRTFAGLRVRWMVSFNYMSPNQFFDGHLANGRLYTAPDGSLIHYAGQLQFSLSDPQNAFYFNPRGGGFSVHLATGLRWKSSSFDVEVRDLGRLYWNIGTGHYALDTSFHFGGVIVPHVLRLDTTFLRLLEDSARQAFLRPLRKARTATMLPTLIGLRFTGYFPGERVGLTAQVRYRFSLFQRPEVALGLYTHPHPSVALLFSGQYGGWGGWNGGLHLAAQLGHGWRLMLGTSLLDGMLAPAHSSGLGGYFCISKGWY